MRVVVIRSAPDYITEAQVYNCNCAKPNPTCEARWTEISFHVRPASERRLTTRPFLMTATA